MLFGSLNHNCVAHNSLNLLIELNLIFPSKSYVLENGLYRVQSAPKLIYFRNFWHAMEIKFVANILPIVLESIVTLWCFKLYCI